MVAPPRSGGRSLGRTYHRRSAWRKAAVAGLALAGIAIAGLCAFLRWKPFRVAVAGSSMLPALEPGDWALVTATRRIRPGSIVVVAHPSRPGVEMVKRVIGVPGDRAPDGRELGRDEYWVEGDATASSTDSRAFGPIGRADVRGTLRVVYWPPARRRRW
jgi:nickel-type superoxide dismutase maturation protease